MATIGQSFPTLIDANKASAEGVVIELLALDNPVLDDAIAQPCNMGTIHRHSIRTGLPAATWGRLYQGVQASKGTLQQVDDTTGFLETRSEVDTRILKLAKDPAKTRLVESAPYLESMNQEMATGIFYHDTATTPEKFKGLAARYSVYNSNPPSRINPNIANQVIHGGGSGANNTSIWFVTWGDHATSLLYPEGMTAGLKVDAKNEEPKTDPNNGGTYYVKPTMFEWHLGMSVKDWRYNARIANIDVPAMLAGNVDLWALLRKGYYRLKSRRRNAISSRIAIYMNTDVLEILDAQSSDRALLAANPNYTGLGHAQVEGKEVRTYRGIPIRETDALLNTEQLVPSIAL